MGGFRGELLVAVIAVCVAVSLNAVISVMISKFYSRASFERGRNAGFAEGRMLGLAQARRDMEESEREAYRRGYTAAESIGHLLDPESKVSRSG